MRLMSTGTDLSMLVAGTVSVTNASLPTRCAEMVLTAAGIRMVGASGGPFFPHAATTKAARTTKNHEDFFETTKTTKFTLFVSFFTRPPPDLLRPPQARGVARRGGRHPMDGTVAHRR